MGFTNYKSLYKGIYADAAEFGKLKAAMTLELENSPGKISVLCRQWEKANMELVRQAEKLEGTDFSRLSNAGLLDAIAGMVKRLRKSSSYIFMNHVFADYFEGWLNRLLLERVDDYAERKRFFQILSSPTRPTMLATQKRSLKRIAKAVRENGMWNSKRLLAEHAGRFAWMGYDTGIGKDLTVAEVKTQVKGFLGQSQEKKPRASRAEIMRRLGMGRKEELFLKIFNEVFYASNSRVESQMIAGQKMRPVFEEAARRLGAEYEDIVYLTFGEIEDSLGGKRIDFEEIGRRKRKFGLLMLGGHIYIFSGNEVSGLESQTDIPLDTREFSGLIANMGFVKGPVKIVATKSDLGKINIGDILVSKMTTPDFVVALERCSGIITDIGGITCHAAIIAREMEKPCITGTKFATSVLKDNDIVELDANRGVIRKVQACFSGRQRIPFPCASWQAMRWRRE